MFLFLARQFQALSELIFNMTQSYGALGISMAMFAESIGIPFASSVVILGAGTLIARGKITFTEAIFYSTLGITLGSLCSYTVGLAAKRAGRRIWCKNNGTSVTERKCLTTLFLRYGYLSIVLAQLFGTTRTFISFPAGMMEMKVLPFILYTALGGALFSVLTITFSHLFTQLVRWSWKAFFYLPKPLVFVTALLIVVTVALLARYKPHRKLYALYRRFFH